MTAFVPHPYQKAVIRKLVNAKRFGLFLDMGTGKTAFSPDAKVTRAQTVTFLYRYEQSQGGGFTGAWAFPLDFSDAADVAQWAYEPFCWMTTHGVVAGSGGKLLPNANCSRAEIVTMLARYFAPA